MSNKHLKRSPINISEKSWYYEDERGIQVYARVEKTNGTTIGIPVIPWRKIRSSLKRKDVKGGSESVKNKAPADYFTL